MNNKNTPEFNHRGMQEDEQLPIDLYANIAESVENIQTFTELLNSHSSVSMDETKKDHLLKQIELCSQDILSVVESFANNHESTQLINGDAVQDVESVQNEDTDSLPPIDVSEVDRSSGTREDAIQRLNEGEVYADIAIRDLNTKDANEVAYKFSEYFADFASTNTNEHVSAVLMGFLPRFFSLLPKYKKITSVSALVGEGGSIADDVLQDMIEVKDEADIKNVVVRFSELLAHHAHTREGQDNQLILMGFLDKILKASIEAEEIEGVDNEAPTGSLTKAGVKGEQIGDDVLADLKNAAGNNEDIEHALLNVSEYLAALLRENTPIDSYAILYNFLMKVLNDRPQDKLKTAA